MTCMLKGTSKLHYQDISNEPWYTLNIKATGMVIKCDHVIYILYSVANGTLPMQSMPINEIRKDTCLACIQN